MGILNGDIFGPDEMFRFALPWVIAAVAIAFAVGNWLTRRRW